jgi:hypothetical protein
MSKERELLVKAWNLLIYLMGGKIGDGISSINRKFLYELKEYISQPEQPEQTEQEPVATKLESHQFTAFHVSADDFKKLQKLPTGTKIYTAPPKREPLSTKQAEDLWETTFKSAVPYYIFDEICTAIEKHHGIGVEL